MDTVSEVDRLTLPELKERLRSRVWRLNNLYWILDKRGTPILFKMNRAQRRYLESRHYLNVNLKARQMGFSTGIQIDMLDRCLFNSNWNAGIIAQDLPTATDIFDNKVKFALRRLPKALLAKVAPTQDSSRSIKFRNGSSITVGTSLRGGTLQQLHVSELGKIAAQFPAKAREIKTGAFNTVAAGQIIDVESTAEGQEGEFYDRVELARMQTDRAIAAGRDLMEMEWKFHFFAWWEDPGYMVNPKGVVIPHRMIEYFKKLRKEHGIKLMPGQKAWYTLKEEEQGVEEMHREYPSFPDEAFEIAIKGAYYADQIRQLRQDGRITKVPYSEAIPVHTAWDLGMNDMTAIWFFQVVGREIRVIDYYEDHDKTFAHYARILSEKGYWYGNHYGPHDLSVRELFGNGTDEDPKKRFEIAKAAGIHFTVLGRIEDNRDGRESVRMVLPTCIFDEERCDRGIKCLENFKREWDASRGVYSNTYKHDWASHGSKAFESLARAPIFASITGGAREVSTATREMNAWT